VRRREKRRERNTPLVITEIGNYPVLEDAEDPETIPAAYVLMCHETQSSNPGPTKKTPKVPSTS
jgi:hypothetical protein